MRPVAFSLSRSPSQAVGLHVHVLRVARQISLDASLQAGQVLLDLGVRGKQEVAIQRQQLGTVAAFGRRPRGLVEDDVPQALAFCPFLRRHVVGFVVVAATGYFSGKGKTAEACAAAVLKKGCNTLSQRLGRQISFLFSAPATSGTNFLVKNTTRDRARAGY